MAFEKVEELEADGNIAWLENDFNRAHHCFGRAIQLLDDKCCATHLKSHGQMLKARILCAQAQTYLSQGLAYSALRSAEQAIRWEPSAECRFLRARAICIMEKRDEMYYETEEDHEAYLAKALTDLSAVIRVEPSNAPAKNELAFLEDLRRKLKSEAQVIDNTPLFGTGLTRSQSHARIRPERSPASLSHSASLRPGVGALLRSASGRQLLSTNSRPSSASRIARSTTANGASDTACNADGDTASNGGGAGAAFLAPGGLSGSRSASRERLVASRCRELNAPQNSRTMVRSSSLSRIQSLR
eukprot:GEMP01038143.1.p1 GENE.GEMP01038143.1~~GEMP01038143.1.p1  ORF type:complete len:301 (+),score=81.35 GEMP01038143.1:74-976(+)